jgi:hypothetical protein
MLLLDDDNEATPNSNTQVNLGLIPPHTKINDDNADVILGDQSLKSNQTTDSKLTSFTASAAHETPRTESRPISVSSISSIDSFSPQSSEGMNHRVETKPFEIINVKSRTNGSYDKDTKIFTWKNCVAKQDGKMKMVNLEAVVEANSPISNRVTSVPIIVKAFYVDGFTVVMSL